MFTRFSVTLFILAISTGAFGQTQPPANPPAAPSPSRSAMEIPGLEPHHEQWIDGKKILPPILYQDETPEQRMARLGTVEDPGPDPDPTRKWIRFGKTYTIRKFKRMQAAYDQPKGYVRPMWQINLPREIYQEDLDYVWVWLRDISNDPPPAAVDPALIPADAAPENPALHKSGLPFERYEGKDLEYLTNLREEFKPVELSSAGRSLTFQDSSESLPTTGSWRNGMDVADMNGDGHLDLVLPPPRGGVLSRPYIFLGDGSGRWQRWDSVRWPRMFPYGTVVAGDLNGDGSLDLAFGAHGAGVIAMLGDGKGNFTDASVGLPIDFPTRRIVLEDVDRDGDLDIVGISEVATMQGKAIGSPLRVYLNDGKAKQWSLQVVAEPARQVGGDWIALGNFNGDKYPDIAGASIIFHGTDLIYLSEGKGKWSAFGRGWLPFYSFYGPVTAGKLVSRKRDDLVMTFSRVWPVRVDPNQLSYPELTRMIGLERISFEGKEPKRVPIAQWEGRSPIWAVRIADFDRDGRQDIIYWDSGSRKIEVLLGDGRGGFAKAELEGLSAPENTLYDLTVADLNGDKRPDVIAMFAAEENQNDGSVRVWLNQAGPSETRRIAIRQ